MIKSKEQLHSAMNCFMKAYTGMTTAIEAYEKDLGSVNELEAFTKYYPFDKSFDELRIVKWVLETTDELKNGTTKVDVASMIEHVEDCADAEMKVVDPEYDHVGPITIKLDGVETDLDFSADTYEQLLELLKANT